MSGSLTLRSVLKHATASSHRFLDEQLGPLAIGGDYTRFLQIQYRVHVAVEPLLAAAAPPGQEPPPQASLIALDLRDRGYGLPPHARIEAAAIDKTGFWGAAWAIAGSSLGNRAILVRRRKAGSDKVLGAASVRFLSDPAMPLYWRAILPQIERPAGARETGAAVRAAQAVFTAFATTADEVAALDLAA